MDLSLVITAAIEITHMFLTKIVLSRQSNLALKYAAPVMKEQGGVILSLLGAFSFWSMSFLHNYPPPLPPSPPYPTLLQGSVIFTVSIAGIRADVTPIDYTTSKVELK